MFEFRAVVFQDQQLDRKEIAVGGQPDFGAVLAGVAVPSMRSFNQHARAADQTNSLVGALTLARNEAITRGVPVTICASSDAQTCADSPDWSTGWIVFTDITPPTGSVDQGSKPDRILRVASGLPDQLSLNADSNFIAYAATGFQSMVNGTNFTLGLTPCTGNNNREISVNPQGRVFVKKIGCL